jgi:membrane protease YdiL (CAAX protease family)
MRSFASAFATAATLLVAVTSYFAFSPSNAGGLVFWALAGGPSVALGVVAALWGVREDLLRSWMSPRWGDFTRGIVGAALFFGLAWTFARFVTPVGSVREIWLVSLYGQIGDPQVLRAHAPLVGCAIVLASVGEELVWRGMITQVLADRFGSRTGWLGAAALYAVAYVPTMWSLRAGTALNPILVAAALGGGLLWGGMVRVFGGLVPSVVAHAFFDWAVLIMVPLWGVRVDL